MFYENLEKELKKRKITLNKLSKEIGIAQSQTTKWKKGYLPGSEILIKICDYLNVSSDYLLGLETEPTENRIDQLKEPEKILLENYRELDERAKEFIFEMAAREAEKIKQQETSSNSKIG